MEILAKSTGETLEQHLQALTDQANLLLRLGYITKEQHRILVEASRWHDSGKDNPKFQDRMRDPKKKFDPEGEVPHNILSGYFIDKGLYSYEDYIRILHSAINHHAWKGKCNIDYIRGNKKLIRRFTDRKIKARDLKTILDTQEDPKMIRILGLLHKVDYAASGNFPAEQPADFMEAALEELGYSWNSLQEFCRENQEKNLVIRAQTGMGKTEAGLLWAGNNKTFFLLPLKNAINAIYLRITENIVKIPQGRVCLLHSGARDILDPGQYTVAKNLSLPLTICTLDQVFNFVFKQHGYTHKLATLGYSKVVIDEIQMYSPDLIAYLIYGLKKVDQLGGKFIILSATIPPFLRKLLRREGLDFREKQFVDNKKRHNMKLIDKHIDDRDSLNLIREGSSLGKKVLVVVNTVKKAQKLHELLYELSPKLLHSKFIKKHRAEKEAEIMEVGDTGYTESCIWIATQVVEASLDIDFDLLYTELPDINGLFQRLGRVNRRGIKSTEEYNAFIFKEKFTMVDKTIKNLTEKALEGVDGIITEQDKMNLIEKYFTTEALEGSGYITEYREKLNFIKNLAPGTKTRGEVAREFRNIDSYHVVPCKFADMEDLEEYIVSVSNREYRKLELLDKGEYQIAKNMQYCNEKGWWIDG